jgi:hypothetical protein
MLYTDSAALFCYATAPAAHLSFDPVRSAVRIELALALRQFGKHRNLNRLRCARLLWLALRGRG